MLSPTTLEVPMCLQVPLHCSTTRSLPSSPPCERSESSSPTTPTCYSDCGCIIDANSPPDQLERDFHAWLRLGSTSPSDVDSSLKCTIQTIVTEAEDDMEDLNGSSLQVKQEDIDESGETDLRKAKKKGTNLYGRPYCPGRPLSMKERLQIIQFHTSGMKVNAISKSLCISHGCVSKIITRYRLTGILTPVSSPEHRKQRRKKYATEPSQPSCSTSSSHISSSPSSSSAPITITTPQLSPISPQQPQGVIQPMIRPSPTNPPPIIHHNNQMYTDVSGSTYSFLQPISSPTSTFNQLPLTPHPNQQSIVHPSSVDYSPYPYLYTS